MDAELKKVIMSINEQPIQIDSDLCAEVIVTTAKYVRNIRKLKLANAEPFEPGSMNEAFAVTLSLISKFQNNEDNTASASEDFLARATLAIKELIEVSDKIDHAVGLMHFVRLGLAQMTDDEAREIMDIELNTDEEQIS